MPTFNCPLVHTTHSDGRSASSPSTMQNLTRADPKLRSAFAKSAAKSVFLCYIWRPCTAYVLRQTKRPSAFVDEIGNRIFRFTSGSWPAQKTKLRDGSAGRCVLWEQGRALATGQRTFRGHHFRQSNSVRPLQNRLSCWWLMSKTTPLLSWSRGDRQDSFSAQEICEPRSKERGWCRAAQPRLSPATHPVHRLWFFYFCESRSQKQATHRRSCLSMASFASASEKGLWPFGCFGILQHATSSDFDTGKNRYNLVEFSDHQHIQEKSGQHFSNGHQCF